MAGASYPPLGRAAVALPAALLLWLAAGCTHPADFTAEDALKAARQFVEGQVTQNSSPAPLRTVGYALGRPEADVRGWRVRAATQSVYPDQAVALLREQVLTLTAAEGTRIGRDRQLRVSESRATATHTARGDGLGLYYLANSAGDPLTVRTAAMRKLLDLRDLPDEFSPLGARPDVRFGVGKDGWGPLAIAPDGSRIAFTTTGEHPFSAVVGTDGRDLTPLDLYVEAKPQLVAWSADGRNLAVVVHNAAGTTHLAVYDLAARRRLDAALRNRWELPQYSVQHVFWRDAAALLQFQVGSGTAPGGDPRLLGTWEWNLTTGEMTRVTSGSQRNP